MATSRRRKPFKASTVRRKRKPAGSSIEPNRRVEESHVGFMRRWAGAVNSIQRSHWAEIRKLIISEQRRLGTRSDNIVAVPSHISERGRAPGIREPAVPSRRFRGDELPDSIRRVDALVNEMVAEYAAKFAADEDASEERVESIEGSLETTSSTAWADNIESLVNQTPGLSGAEKTEINEFLIAEEPDIPRSVRRNWIREQLGLISGKPVAPVRVAGKLIESISGRSMKRVRSAITKGILRGTRVESIMGQLAAIPGMTSRHAELLARDQVVKQNGRMTRIRHEGISVTHYLWQTVRDDRVRPTHKAFGRKRRNRYSYKKGAGPNGVNPGEEIQCFPAETPISASGIVRVTKRMWDGELATLVTFSGLRLRSTPNHPVLTCRGWIGLGSLQSGDYVFEISGDSAGVHDDNERVACIGDLFESARDSGMSPVAFTGGEFHGDSTDKQVDVVSVDGMLHGHLEARSYRGGLKLVDPGPPQPRPTKSQISEMLCGLRLSTGGPMGSSDRLLSLDGAHAGPSSLHRVRPASNSDISLIERSSDRIPVAPVSAREFELGNSGLVLRAHLVDSVSCEKWRGHVFNAETTSGWYQAQGLVVSNCRCWASPDLLGAVRNLRKKKARGDSLAPSMRIRPRRVPRSVVSTVDGRADAARAMISARDAFELGRLQS